MKNIERRQFYCLNCGKENMPIYRNVGRARGKGHRKKLYCPWCKQEVNHLECRTQEEIDQFKKDFNEGFFKEEAEMSINYIKERIINFNV